MYAVNWGKMAPHHTKLEFIVLGLKDSGHTFQRIGGDIMYSILSFSHEEKTAAAQTSVCCQGEQQHMCCGEGACV